MDFCKKKKSSNDPGDIENQYGQTWIWTAIDASTRLLITFWIGGRELDDARRMLRDLTDRALNKPLFVSDELPHYSTVPGELFHKLVPTLPTGASQGDRAIRNGSLMQIWIMLRFIRRDRVHELSRLSAK